MKSKLITAAFVTLLGIGLITQPKDANAYKGDPNVKGPNYTADRHEAMEKAFANKDYNAWKSLMTGKGRVQQVVNKDNFAKFAAAHALAEQGKITDANKIRAELGLGLQNGSGKGMGMGRNAK